MGRKAESEDIIGDPQYTERQISGDFPYLCFRFSGDFPFAILFFHHSLGFRVIFHRSTIPSFQLLGSPGGGGGGGGGMCVEVCGRTFMIWPHSKVTVGQIKP